MTRSTRQPTHPRPWFEAAFDDDYLERYAHRDQSEAARLAAALDRAHGWEGPVLDLACGGGRFLRAAPRSVTAVGCDLSLPLLSAARDAGRPLVRGDMRQLPFRTHSLRRVVLLFTSFGYFETRDEDAVVLSEIARVLGSGGLFVLDFFDAVQLQAGLTPSSSRSLDGAEVAERRWIDPTGPFVMKEVSVTRGVSTRRHFERVRLYSRDELAALVEGTGFTVSSIWGDYDGGPSVSGESLRCIVLATRRESM